MARRLSLVSFVQSLSGYGTVLHVWGFLCVLLVFMCLSTRECGSVGLCWWQGASVACRKKQQIWGSCTRAPASDRSITYRVAPGSLRASLSCGLLLLRVFSWLQGHHVHCKQVWVLYFGNPMVEPPQEEFGLGVIDHGFFSLGALSVLCHCTPNKRAFTFWAPASHPCCRS